MSTRWPKLIRVRGVAFEVSSWEEADEVIARYGSGQTPDRPPPVTTKKDRERLRLLLEAGRDGVLIKDLAPLFGRHKKKGLHPVLELWAFRIGLRHLSEVAFEGIRSVDGRGYRLKEQYLRRAQMMLEPVSTKESETEQISEEVNQQAGPRDSPGETENRRP